MDKEKINLVLVGATMGTNETIASMAADFAKHEIMIIDTFKREEEIFESAGKALIEFGLKASECMSSLKDLTCLCFLAERDSWAPIHGIQAHFFRFDPKKWHDLILKLAPMISHRATYFYRKCWMQAKTFMNVKLPEVEEAIL